MMARFIAETLFLGLLAYGWVVLIALAS